MIKLERLEGHENANAHIIREGCNIELWSYSTKVLIYNTLNKSIDCMGLYSSTTRKHIGWFMNQFIDGFDYYDIKKAYLDNETLYVGMVK